MLHLKDLSFRYKIPLRATLLVLATALIITGAILAREYDQLRRDLFQNAESMGRVLAKTLVTPILHDDVWRAYEIINTPFHSGAAQPLSAFGAELVLVLDPERRIYVSTRPADYPMLDSLPQVDPDYGPLDALIHSNVKEAPQTVELPGSAYFHLIAPIAHDGVLLGTLLMEYPKSVFMPRFLSIVYRAGFVTLLVLAVLLPVSWYWGRRMADPLVQLADCMSMVGTRLPELEECRLYESKDEVGRAGTQLKRMISELHEKQALERGMLANERLAAIGRITAGIAHEINNPLGGMLNAISTLRRHGQPDGIAGRTVSLLERGLMQIKETVAALLVEARVEGHALTSQDLEDIHTLIMANVHRKHLRLMWDNRMSDSVPLPSTQVRQVLLNLLLNAVNAAADGGVVQVMLYIEDDALYLDVENDGAHIGPERMAHLFEPFADPSEQGHGLGLWVTYQLVQQMHGRIEVESQPGRTRFNITLPYGAAT
ncbi:MAG: HAMP domain-containing sensor histidine kinase [Chromatiales bacterium]|jgi:signal transduction histidine kinase|nr:HAMP domain-containing sensor histidine kinase [Chromatiales bacterium]MDX9767117.1 HAMP domain-containing sensor histidine kinase [Ectothiorhodospiraceae bacterium]